MFEGHQKYLCDFIKKYFIDKEIFNWEIEVYTKLLDKIIDDSSGLEKFLVHSE